MLDCTEHSILSLFADDAKCFRIINNIEDCEQLQRDLAFMNGVKFGS